MRGCLVKAVSLHTMSALERRRRVKPAWRWRGRGWGDVGGWGGVLSFFIYPTCRSPVGYGTSEKSGPWWLAKRLPWGVNSLKLQRCHHFPNLLLLFPCVSPASFSLHNSLSPPSCLLLPLSCSLSPFNQIRLCHCHICQSSIWKFIHKKFTEKLE